MNDNDGESIRILDEDISSNDDSDASDLWTDEDEDDNDDSDSWTDDDEDSNDGSESDSYDEDSDDDSDLYSEDDDYDSSVDDSLYSSDTYDDDTDADEPFLETENSKPFTVPRLELIASVSVAIALWNRATTVLPGMLTNNKEWRSSLTDEVCKWIDALPLPKSLTIGIKKHFNVVKINVANWTSCHSSEVFFERVESELYQYLDNLAWYPNGSINFIETARNLLKSEKLTNSEKFYLACTFCLREEIEMLRPMLNENDFLDEFQFWEYPLIGYWQFYYSNKLEKVHDPEIDPPIDEFMIKQPNVTNWPAIEYFFDRLNDEQKVPVAIWLIDEHDIHFQKSVLTKLNEAQRLLVLSDRVINIISNYASYPGNEDDVITTWYEVYNLITEDQFVSLFKELLEVDAKDSILTEIWNTARDDFKRYIFTSNGDNFISKVLKWCVLYLQVPEEGFSFVLLVLSHPACEDIKREITKKKFFNKCCKECILDDYVEFLDRLINLCLPEAAESRAFKLSLTKQSYFTEHCETLIDSLEVGDLVKLLNFSFVKTDPTLNEFVGRLLVHLDEDCLEYYSTGNLIELNDLLAPLMASYPEIVSDYKKELLLSQDGVKACMNHFCSTSDVLDEIIADGLPIKSLVAKFKNKIIFSPKGIDKLEALISNGRLEQAKKWIGWFLDANGSRKKLKMRLFDRQKAEIARFLCDVNRDSQNSDNFVPKLEYFAEIFRFLSNEKENSESCHSVFSMFNLFEFEFLSIKAAIFYVIFFVFVFFLFFI